jgi:polyhydroxyalkanoate synthesis regulator phasin
VKSRSKKYEIADELVKSGENNEREVKNLQDLNDEIKSKVSLAS